MGACCWIQIAIGGLGRHTITVGGPVGPGEIVEGLKVMVLQMSWFATLCSLTR